MLMVEIKPECDVARLMSVVSRGLCLVTLRTPLFVGSFLTVSWAQGISESPTPAPSFLSAAEITSQFNYYCPSNTPCSFFCSGGELSETKHEPKLTVYLGKSPLGNNKIP